jgi:hypothetical protein
MQVAAEAEPFLGHGEPGLDLTRPFRLPQHRQGPCAAARGEQTEADREGGQGAGGHRRHGVHAGQRGRHRENAPERGGPPNEHPHGYDQRVQHPERQQHGGDGHPARRRTGRAQGLQGEDRRQRNGEQAGRYPQAARGHRGALQVVVDHRPQTPVRHHALQGVDEEQQPSHGQRRPAAVQARDERQHQPAQRSWRMASRSASPSASSR